MRDETKGSPRHPIRVVARRTGLSLATLRAWEKRYQVVDPHRSAGGHRLYRDEDISRLRLLREAVQGGRSIGQIADLSLEELEELVVEDGRSLHAAAQRSGGGREEAAVFLEEALEAVRAYDVARVERILMRAAMTLQPGELLDQVVVGLLSEVGDLWHKGSVNVAQEHASSVAIQRFLGWLIGNAEVGSGARTIVFTTPAGQRHEFGALLAAAAAALEGWRAVYLGADLPAPDIAEAVAGSGAVAVAMSAVVSGVEPDPVSEILALREAVPEGVQIIAGGPALEEHAPALSQEGVVVVESLGGFRESLRALAFRSVSPLGG